MLQLMMVGTGGAFAKEYFNTSALLMSSEYTLLIDCGATVPLALHRLGKTLGEDILGKIDGILISHAHGDHINGLEEVAYQMKYKYQKKIDLIGPSDVMSSLWLDSLRGGLSKTAEGIQYITDYFDIRAIATLGQNDILTIADITIKQIKTNHIPLKPSYGFIFNDKLWYSGDTKFDRKQIEQIAPTVDWIFHDCQLENYLINVHATLDELISLPIDIRNQMWLMHYGDNMPEFKEKAHEASLTFAKEGEIYDIN